MEHERDSWSESRPDIVCPVDATPYDARGNGGGVLLQQSPVTIKIA